MERKLQIHEDASLSHRFRVAVVCLHDACTSLMNIFEY